MADANGLTSTATSNLTGARALAVGFCELSGNVPLPPLLVLTLCKPRCMLNLARPIFRAIAPRSPAADHHPPGPGWHHRRAGWYHWRPLPQGETLRLSRGPPGRGEAGKTVSVTGKFPDGLPVRAVEHVAHPQPCLSPFGRCTMYTHRTSPWVSTPLASLGPPTTHVSPGDRPEPTRDSAQAACRWSVSLQSTSPCDADCCLPARRQARMLNQLRSLLAPLPHAGAIACPPGSTPPKATGFSPTFTFSAGLKQRKPLCCCGV